MTEAKKLESLIQAMWAHYKGPHWSIRILQQKLEKLKQK